MITSNSNISFITDFLTNTDLTQKHEFNAQVDFKLNGRRKLCESKVAVIVSDQHFEVKLLNESLFRIFPTSFYSGTDVFLSDRNGLVITGGNLIGKYQVLIHPE